ncbi:MAG: hypothetical protein M5T61_01065 [Acidimicrobiia bacterium]|nr:hypothetical protein [Acidimicrobiia bacterium]
MSGAQGGAPDVGSDAAPDDSAGPPLRLTARQRDEIVAHCRAAVVELWGERFLAEACGLLSGPMVDGDATGVVSAVHPCRNTEESARLYTVEPRDLLGAVREPRPAATRSWVCGTRTRTRRRIRR